ncbi:unnamed protein product, partial [Meganyctiphanes norvegica]
MMDHTASVVRFLKNKHIEAPEEWITACIQFVQGSELQGNDANVGQLCPHILVQWLLTEELGMDEIKVKKSFRISASQFYGISVAPDRSYKERQEYRILRIEMDSKNENLTNAGVTSNKWIIRHMRLILIHL